MLRKRLKSRTGRQNPTRLIHYSEEFLSDFYEKWSADPESVSDNAFFHVHMHLLACEVCSRLAKQCEDRAGSHTADIKRISACS
jgi:hypothetical protein